MTQRRLVVCLTFVALAYFAGFAALYIDRLLPTFRAIGKALGT